jgi:thymidylate kinase
MSTCDLLPSIARLFGKPVKEGPVTDPHGSKPSGFFGSFLRLSYYSLDYVLGYWLKVYPALVKQPTLYIFDRYFYDYYIDSRRGMVSLPKWLIKLYGIFIPSPDVILCLGADAEAMHARKPELPLEEVKRQVKELQAFYKSNKRAVWIDTGCSIEESVDKALEVITSRMAARYAK